MPSILDFRHAALDAAFVHKLAKWISALQPSVDYDAITLPEHGWRLKNTIVDAFSVEQLPIDELHPNDMSYVLAVSYGEGRDVEWFRSLSYESVTLNTELTALTLLAKEIVINASASISIPAFVIQIPISIESKNALMDQSTIGFAVINIDDGEIKRVNRVYPLYID